MEIITGVVIGIYYLLIKIKISYASHCLAIISVLVTIYLQKLKAKQTQKKIKSNYAKKVHGQSSVYSYNWKQLFM